MNEKTSESILIYIATKFNVEQDRLIILLSELKTSTTYVKYYMLNDELENERKLKMK